MSSRGEEKSMIYEKKDSDNFLLPTKILRDSDIILLSDHSVKEPYNHLQESNDIKSFLSLVNFGF